MIDLESFDPVEAVLRPNTYRKIQGLCSNPLRQLFRLLIESYQHLGQQRQSKQEQSAY